MKRRHFLKSAALAAIAGRAVTKSVSAAQPPRKPNIVIVLIDDLGYGDIGCFGAKDIPTPHMDSLAKNGVKCTNSYITNPPCSPSRCSLMMGMYAQKFGKSGMARGLPIPDDKPTLAEFMRDAGYVTGHIGKWDIGSYEQGPLDRGFMEVARRPVPHNSYKIKLQDGSDGYLTDVDGDYMAEFVERNKSKPFFLYFSPVAVHSPTTNTTPDHYRKRTRARKERKGLAGAIVAVDDAIGKLLEALKKHGIDKDTLILLTGDNGANLGEGGSSAPYRGGKGTGTNFDGWVHTPGVVSWPRVIPGGQTYEGLTCTLDYYATIAAACGKPLPRHCDGINMIPYFTGKKQGDAHEMIFWYNADPTDWHRRHLSAVRWKNWRLVMRKGSWQLFDMKADPAEETDLTDKHGDVAKTMKDRHDTWIAKLPPIKPSKSFTPIGGRLPNGWGWATDASDEKRVCDHGGRTPGRKKTRQ